MTVRRCSTERALNVWANINLIRAHTVSTSLFLDNFFRKLFSKKPGHIWLFEDSRRKAGLSTRHPRKASAQIRTPFLRTDS